MSNVQTICVLRWQHMAVLFLPLTLPLLFVCDSLHKWNSSGVKSGGRGGYSAPFLRYIHRPGNFHWGSCWHFDCNVGVPHLAESKVFFFFIPIQFINGRHNGCSKDVDLHRSSDSCFKKERSIETPGWQRPDRESWKIRCLFLLKEFSGNQ